MQETLAHFFRNPAYGSGIYRRRVTMTAAAEVRYGQIDDTHHSMWLSFRHDGAQILAVDSGYTRAPATTCKGARTGLRALIGLPLDASLSDIRARTPPICNCTHLTDLSGWVLQNHAPETRYDIVIPDAGATPVTMEVSRDDRLLHRWEVAEDHIVAPDAFAGQSLGRGFMRWANARFAGEQLTGAMMLQRGILVARGRAYIVDAAPATPLAAAAGMEGACLSYSPASLETAVATLDYVRDFTRGVEVAPPPSRLNRTSG